MMKTYRTAAQWLALLQQRSNFKGTNIEFCQHHNIAITTYYKQRALLVKQSNPNLPQQTLNATSSRFIQLKQTTTEVCAQTHQNVVQFDIRTGQLMFRKRLGIYTYFLTFHGNRLSILGAVWHSSLRQAMM
ncbi:IS66 family insertion sequence element accessory protein TnpB [Shewanella metallivivens]|uniref:IS66 family insertion sequence element accessory protein TnpB n=1 Tax=Shewanella metallivivens TaxID=2872342 RepID=A0ABT5TRC2_9GAMM|nr:IS66 family insertion sequence element accessory protein TnpB [Shewanella metallivivens]MDD8060359.1 IS66 family insertion sequence element accessory protein TnpB [Shewanella metallivivens]